MISSINTLNVCILSVYSISSSTRSKKPAPPSGAPVLIIVQNSMSPSSSATMAPDLFNCRPVLPKPVVHTLPPLKNLTIGPDKISFETILNRTDRVKQVAETQTDIYGVDHLCVNSANSQPTLLANIGTQVGVCSLPLDQLNAARPSAEVQTSLSIRHNRQKFCSVAETQTSGDNILRSAMESAEIPVHNHKQMATQYVPLDFKQFRSSEVQINLVPKRKRKRKQTVIPQNVVGNVYSASSSDDFFESMVGDLGSSISTQTHQSFLETIVGGRNEQLHSSETQTYLTLFNSSENNVTQRSGSAAKRKGMPHRLTHAKRRKPTGAIVETRVSTQDKICAPPGYQNIALSRSNLQDQQLSSPHTSSPSNTIQTNISDVTSQRKQCTPFSDGEIYVHGGPAASTKSSRDLCPEIPLRVINQNSECPTNYAVTQTFEMDHMNHPDFLDLADRLVAESGSSMNAACQTLSLESSNTNMTRSSPHKSSETQTAEDVLHKQCSVGVSAFIPSTDMCTQTAEYAMEKNMFQKPESHNMLQSVCLSLSETSQPTVDTIESSVQTLTSSTDLDQLVRSEIQKSMLKQASGTEDIHTQTADELLDFLMMNMETQTTDDLFCGFSDTETQTNSLETQTHSLGSTWSNSEKQADGHNRFSHGNRTTFHEITSAGHFAIAHPSVSSNEITEHTASVKTNTSTKDSSTSFATSAASTDAASTSTGASWSGLGENEKCHDSPWLYSPVSAQTQTACSGLWLNSVTAAAETQTTLIQPLMDLSDDDMTLCMDMETQTHFSIMDESIGDLTDSHTQTTFQDLNSLFSP